MENEFPIANSQRKTCMKEHSLPCLRDAVRQGIGLIFFRNPEDYLFVSRQKVNMPASGQKNILNDQGKNEYAYFKSSVIAEETFEIPITFRA